MGAGRKSKDSLIYDNLERIKQWKRMGATEEQIFEKLGIASSTWYRYKQNIKELREAIKESNEIFCVDLKGELTRQAFKHTLETKKQFIKVNKQTGETIQYTEIITKEVDGNIGAIHLLLKNIDKDHWSDNWKLVELREQELELRKQQVEDSLF